MTFHDKTLQHLQEDLSNILEQIYAANTILVLITGTYICTHKITEVSLMGKYFCQCALFLCDLTTYTWYTIKLEIYNLGNFL